MQQVGQWIQRSGRTASEVARLAGVSRSTIARIAAGTVSPTTATLREIALACDRDLLITDVALSDANAAQAARLLLEEGFMADDPEAAGQWVERIQRRGLNDPIAIVTFAGHCSSPRIRSGASFFAGTRAQWKAASAGEASGSAWALSGTPVLQAGQVTVMHAADQHAVTTALTDSMEQLSSASGANLIVVLATPGTFYDSWADGAIQLVAPIQGLIDAVGAELSPARVQHLAG